MKKLLLFLPLVFLGAKFGVNEPLKQAKEELNLAPTQTRASSQFNIPIACTQRQNDDDDIHSGYKHCRTCNYGVFLEHEGIIKCTYCGIRQ